LSPPDRDLFADLDLVDDGAGVPVVFSHGGHSDLSYWEPQRQDFSARYRFVACSRPDNGSAEQHAASLCAVVSRLEAGPAHVVGFSTAIALFMSYQAPDTFNAVVLDFLAQH
jgi:pimeloyl-ACP methyl ester carboxylesterase